MEERPAVLDHLAESLVHRFLSQGRIIVEVADELPRLARPRVVDVFLDGPRRQIRCGQRFEKGTEQATNCSPGGRSFSSPIHERGQPFRSRQ